MAHNNIRILVADDHPLFREGVVHSLIEQPGFEIVAEAASGEQALKFAKDLLPDVILLDIHMPGIGGITAAEKIASACPAVKIVILTVSEDGADLTQAMKAGASGYILKGVSSRHLASAIRRIDQGEVYISPSLATSMLLEMTQTEIDDDPLAQLTWREKEILELVSQGLSNREIGESLILAEKTIKHYMSNVLRKLHVRSRVEAALLAERSKGKK